MALSALQWGCIVAVIWLSLSAIDQTVPLPAALAVWVLMVIGLTLPSAPAQLGTTQLAYVAGLTLAEIDAATAFAASAIYTCTVNLPIMLVGWSCWGLVHRSDLVVRVRAEESS